MSGAATLLTVANQVLAALAGTFTTRPVYFVAYLDGFSRNGSELSQTQKGILDAVIAGSGGSAFPFRPGQPNHRIVLLAGMASQTGPEANNVALGHQRARAVYNHLKAGLGTAQLDENIQSVGSSRPRKGFDSPGSEHAQNRAVGIVLRVDMPIVAAPPPPPPPSDPPPPKSRQWELGVTGYVSVSDPIPWFDLYGLQYITGTLKNSRTGEVRGYRIIAGGYTIGYSALPIEIAVNFQGQQLTAFNTHWCTFDDFDNTLVLIAGVGVADVYEYAPSIIGFVELNTQVAPSGVTLKTNIGGSAIAHYGILLVDNQ